MPGLPAPDNQTLDEIDMDRVAADRDYRRRVVTHLRRGWRAAEMRRQGSLFYDPAPAEED